MVRDGYIYGLSMLGIAGVLAWATDTWVWSIVPILLAAFFLWFFRDPPRSIPQGEGLIVSPADGLVTETARIETAAGPRKRISIFLNVFDVHVNRTPIAGEITSVRYQSGKFLNAMNRDCAESNEQNIVTVRGEGMEIVFKQIAGLIARRIVFKMRQGDRVERGQRVGMIKFGSRTDVILPAQVEFRVKTGERVKGGASIIAEMPASELMAGVTSRPREMRASVEPERAEGDDGELR